jgi:hypothetical protein
MKLSKISLQGNRIATFHSESSIMLSCHSNQQTAYELRISPSDFDTLPQGVYLGKAFLVKSKSFGTDIVIAIPEEVFEAIREIFQEHNGYNPFVDQFVGKYVIESFSNDHRAFLPDSLQGDLVNSLLSSSRVYSIKVC